ncbi:MAG: GH36-type glycosyl hydrolase domain-containing protein [Acidobacteriota bacterium]
MDRRTFIEWAGLGICGHLVPQDPAAAFLPARRSSQSAGHAESAAAYGSGHFGQWITDPFGLPAYQYTCDQITDARALSPVDKAWRSPADHTHQVGNNRLVAAVSNYGYVQVRQDEGSPKFLNDYDPEQRRYGAGIGFLADGDKTLSTWYSGQERGFERIFGIGYLRKRVAGHEYAIDQVIFAPFGDDPVLISQVTLTNHSSHATSPRWVEYWGCHNYQFSYRSLMESALIGGATSAPALRRDFCNRFTHHFQAVDGGRGLLESQSFRGRSAEEEAAWQQVQAKLRENPHTFYGGPVPPLAPGASMDDLHPPATFLVSLDAPADRYATDGDAFFQGGVEGPSGVGRPLDNDLSTSSPGSALLLERQLTLRPGESRSLYFLYGYLPDGFALEQLIAKYEKTPSSLWATSSAQWKRDGVRFRSEAEPWIERETTWSSYYLRSEITYDSFFREHIISQGAPYQYIAGLQGAARDPLQHALPFVFTDPEVVRGVLRYTLKEIQSDGSLPYGIVGSGVPMPCQYRPSDLELWLLWVASEYVLGTRDKGFLEERIPVYGDSGSEKKDRSVRELLEHAFRRITETIGVGQHGLMRLLNGDWNDSIVVNRFTPAQSAEVVEHGESVLNAAMASYVLSYYAQMLDFIGHAPLAEEARAKAEGQRQAVRKQWAGRWFRRAWLGEELGWSGDKPMWLEPQPWALLGGCATPDQAKTLVESIDELARRPSPIGALLQSQPDPTMKDEAGVGTNGGIFASINGTLIWALAQADGAMAWDEWKKNTLAGHAAAYPDFWFGIWSGPDAYNSVLAKSPGATGPDFPVMNMHPHAWPLYSASKLLGLGFHPRGIVFRPNLPLATYEFSSPLMGFRKSRDGYSGWYAPMDAGKWEIELTLPNDERGRVTRIKVNGSAEAAKGGEPGLRLEGESKPGSPLRWEVIL